MRSKILLLGLACSLAAGVLGGATLAYFKRSAIFNPMWRNMFCRNAAH
jgi:hypothetical protein